jgi:DNA-directed RNA polymerase specialized sigma24 family protein
MKPYGLKNYRQQSAYWRKMQQQNPAGLGKALTMLKPEIATVLRLHYAGGKPLKEIGGLIGKSNSTARSHHNRGIFLVFQYLEYPQAPSPV